MHEHDINAAEATRQLQDSKPSRKCSGMDLPDGDQYCNSRVQSKFCLTNRSDGQRHVPSCRIEPVVQGYPLSCAAPRTSSCFGDHGSCTLWLHCIYSVVPRPLMSPVTICQCDQVYRIMGRPATTPSGRVIHDGRSSGVTSRTSPKLPLIKRRTAFLTLSVSPWHGVAKVGQG